MIKNDVNMNRVKNRANLLKFIFIFIGVSSSVLGMNIYEIHRFRFLCSSEWLSFLCTLLIIIAVTWCLYYFSQQIDLDSINVKRFINIDSKGLFILCFLICLVLLIGYYPGTQSWDTYKQIADYYDGISTTKYKEGGGMMITAFLNDHHPITTTFIFSFFVCIGKWIKNEKLGVFFYSVIQIVLYSYAYVRVKKRLAEYKGNAATDCTLFYIFNFFLPYYAILMVKDSIYSVLFLIYYLDYVIIFDSQTNNKREKKWFILLSILLPLMRKTGIYIVLISNIFLFLNKRKSDMSTKLTICSGVIIPTIIMFFILPRIIFPIAGIYSGGNQEVIGTLLQQSARVGIDHGDAYSDDEICLLNRIFDYDNIEENYKYEKTDPIKNTYKLESVTYEDLCDYYKLWIKTGLRYPESYLKATAGTCAGYFAPVVKLDIYRNNHSYLLSNNPILVFIREMTDGIYEILLKIPGLSVFMYIAVYTWWIPLLGTYKILKRKGFRAMGVMAPVYVTILTLIVSPFSFSRYALPLVIVAPIVVHICEFI